MVERSGTMCIVVVTGLALGVALKGLPWRVHGVMLAGTEEYYERQQAELTAAFHAEFGAGKHWS